MGVNLFMRISDMKKFALKMIIFILCMVMIDCLCGVLFSVLQSHARGGSSRTNYYLSNECDADILVLGSSRAMHHYVPQILDSLGGKAYNAGNDGMGVLLGYGRYLLCAEKNVPKIVLFEMGPFDYVKDDNSKYMKFLRPYGGRPAIRNIISQIGEPFMNLKMLSNMYRQSSRLIPNIRDLWASDNFSNRGYLPLYQKCRNCEEKLVSTEETLELDSIKLKIFDQFVKETISRGSKLYFTISPLFFADFEKTDSLRSKIPHNYLYAFILAEKYNIPLLNNMFIFGISNNPGMFADRTHMNNDGAITYSRLVVEEILNKNRN